MGSPLQAGQSDGTPGAASTPGQGQATLSAIADVSIAAEGAVQESSPCARGPRGMVLGVFLGLLYMVGSFLVLSRGRISEFAQAFSTPLLCVGIAGLVILPWQIWKWNFRTRRAEREAGRKALNSLAHETANGANAIRANLTALREANPDLAATEHLQRVDRALARLDQAVKRSIPR